MDHRKRREDFTAPDRPDLASLSAREAIAVAHVRLAVRMYEAARRVEGREERPS
jgi:hypothetical protein